MLLESIWLAMARWQSVTSASSSRGSNAKRGRRSGSKCSPIVCPLLNCDVRARRGSRARRRRLRRTNTTSSGTCELDPVDASPERSPAPRLAAGRLRRARRARPRRSGAAANALRTSPSAIVSPAAGDAASAVMRRQFARAADRFRARRRSSATNSVGRAAVDGLGRGELLQAPWSEDRDARWTASSPRPGHA